MIYHASSLMYCLLVSCATFLVIDPDSDRKTNEPRNTVTRSDTPVTPEPYKTRIATSRATTARSRPIISVSLKEAKAAKTNQTTTDDQMADSLLEKAAAISETQTQYRYKYMCKYMYKLNHYSFNCFMV